MAWWRIAGAALLLGGLAAVAIGAVLVDQRRDREFAASRTPPPMLQPASPSPSASPSPTPSPSPSEEYLPANDVDDPVEGLLAIEAYRDWLYANPDPARIDHIYDHRCPCMEGFKHELQQLAERGWWSEGDTMVTVLDVEQLGPRDATIIFETRMSESVMYDRSGAVIERRAADDSPFRWRALLFQGPDGRWRILHIARMEP